MTLEITDPYLGKRDIGPKPSDLIKDQLKLLEHFKNDGRIPSKELLQDIAVYKYILKSDEPDKFTDLYLNESQRLRDKRKTINIPKLEVANNLGWELNL